MKKTLMVLAVVLAACGTADVVEEVVAPAPPPAPAPAPAPVEEKEPYTYGDDRALDRLWDKCANDDEDACDDLFWESPVGSKYEEYALERVNELAGVAPLTDQDVTDMLGAAFFLDLVWADMSRDDREALCFGVDLFGAEVAAALVVEEAPTLSVVDVAEWLEATCG